jgi:hypothetical protein
LHNFARVLDLGIWAWTENLLGQFNVPKILKVSFTDLRKTVIRYQRAYTMYLTVWGGEGGEEGGS